MTSYHTLTLPRGNMRVSLHAPGERPQGKSSGSEAICMIDDEQTVLVKPLVGPLNTPGGTAGEDEPSEVTMIRAVRDQACADVTSWQLIAFAHSEILEGDRAGQVMVRDMYVARVNLLPWTRRDADIAERQVVQLNELAAIMSADWPGLEDFSVELVALAQRALSEHQPEG